MPLPAPITPLLDDFNRANEGPPPSARWVTAYLGGNRVLGNVCVADVGGAGGSSWNVDFPIAQEMFLTTPTTPAVQMDIMIRMQANNSILGTYLLAVAAGTGAQLYIENGGYTAIGAAYSFTPTDGDRFVLRMASTTFELFLNGLSQGTRGPDTSFTNGFIGFLQYDTTCTVDNFGGGMFFPKSRGQIIG